jgi:hypothetical protein
MEIDDLNRLKDVREKRRKQRKQAAFWNLMTFFVVLLLLASVGLSVWIYVQPDTPLNPFPPPTLPAFGGLPSQPTVKNGGASVIGSSTPQPTFTPPITLTTTPLAVTITLPMPSQTVQLLFSLTPTQRPVYPYDLKGEPSAIQAFQLSSDKACQWMGVGGQAVDLQNRPAVGILVQLGGYLDRKNYQQTSLTGTALQYGQAGFEFTLTEEPAASNKTLWVQLVDQSQVPLSDRVLFDTFNDCNKNLILINFRQVR